MEGRHETEGPTSVLRVTSSLCLHQREVTVGVEGKGREMQRGGDGEDPERKG